LGKETENAEFHRGRSNIMAVGHLVALGGKKSKGKRNERKGNVFRASIVFLLQKIKKKKKKIGPFAAPWLVV